VDIREERAYQHGFIPGAIHMDTEVLISRECTLPKEKKMYCMFKGRISEEAAECFKRKRYMAYSLSGGYGAWLIRTMKKEERGQGRLERVEKSIRKKFHKELLVSLQKRLTNMSW